MVCEPRALCDLQYGEWRQVDRSKMAADLRAWSGRIGRLYMSSAVNIKLASQMLGSMAYILRLVQSAFLYYSVFKSSWDIHIYELESIYDGNWKIGNSYLQHHLHSSHIANWRWRCTLSTVFCYLFVIYRFVLYFYTLNRKVHQFVLLFYVFI